MTALLSLERLTKSYGPVRAVVEVSAGFEPGRLHAVVGENGAGKSTLLKMAAGIVVPDGGEVRVAGERLAPHTPREALRRRIAMVQQHFALVGVLSALENVMLGAEPVRRLGKLDVPSARSRAEQVARSVGVAIDWDAPVESLGVGDRQRLEIVRALVRDARVIILDEPTAVLTPGEADAIYATLHLLAGAGKAIVVVTHRMDEVREHADEVTVLRRGHRVAQRTMTARDDAEVEAIVRDVMGEEAPAPPRRAPRELGAVALRVTDLRLGATLRGVTFSVRAGEIVGVAGIEGNGQRELVRVLASLEAPDGGRVELLAADAARSQEAVVVVHEDRHAEGLVLDADVRENLLLGELAHFSRGGWVDRRAVDREARARCERGGVVPADLDLLARALSGGNQQKVVVARSIARVDRAAVFVFSHPTRGVDLGAARAIHAEIVRVATAGKAVVVLSSDLGELRSIADRLLVLARGRIVAELPPEAPEARIGDAMLGAQAGEARPS